MSDDDNRDRRPEAKPLNGDGLECFNLKVQLKFSAENNQPNPEDGRSEQAPGENLSLSGYWMENLNTPVAERIKTRFTPGTMFFGLQQKIAAVEKSPADARVTTTLSGDKPDTY